MAYIPQSLLTAASLNTPVGASVSAVKYTNLAVNNSTTLATDPELMFNVAAGTAWALRGMLIYSAANVAGMRLIVTVPLGSTGAFSAFGPAPTVATDGTGNGVVVADPFTQIRPIGSGSSGRMLCPLVASISTRPSIGGTIGLQMAQNVADASDAIIYALSWIKLTRLG